MNNLSKDKKTGFIFYLPLKGKKGMAFSQPCLKLLIVLYNTWNNPFLFYSHILSY